MKCINIRLVHYDEVPEYTQASKDAIVGNTYSRLTGCQFKRSKNKIMVKLIDAEYVF